MSLIPGTYQHYKSENIDDYFTAIGVPYLARKMIYLISPCLQVSMEENKVSVKTISRLWNSENTYTLGIEEDEKLPKATLRSTTNLLNDHELETVSFSEKQNLKHTRHYLFTKDELIMTLSHDKSNIKGKRYFRRQE